jgi:hypothetical protein
VTTRRDFLKLCTAAVAIASAPPIVVRQAAERGFKDAHLEVQLFSTEGVLIGRGETHPRDGERGVIEFDLCDAGQIKEVLVSDLGTGRNVCTLRASLPGEGGDISFNSLAVCTGDTVRVQGLRL